VGGHCISVDPWFLVEAAPDLTPLIRASREVNDSQPHFVVDLVRRALGGELAGKRIAALGLSYKPDVDDLRESPAVEVARSLAVAGAEVRAYEPNKPDAAIEGVTLVNPLVSAVEDADALLLLVGHAPLRALDPFVINQLTRARVVIDTVNGWPAQTWQEAGFRVFRLGVGK
jgi:UDP-N-acetyl-D-mannosaminuronic acid dehydrogenase